MQFSKAQLKRFSKQIRLAEVGLEGQESLADAHILVVGAGGLGTQLLQHLAASGLGKISLIDHDIIDWSNLNRQYLYSPNDIGQAKVQVAKHILEQSSKDVLITSYRQKLGTCDLDQLLSDVQILVDCSDNFEVAFSLNKAATIYKKPFISASVIGFKGYVACYEPPYTACFECFCPANASESYLPNCTSEGVLGSVVGVIASLQALMVQKKILQMNVPSGELIRFDGVSFTFKHSTIERDPFCRNCGNSS